MIDGQGDPNRSQAYAEAVEALFSVSYTAKFTVKKKERGVDYVVMPLEGLWWSDDMSSLESFTEGLCAQILHVGPFSEEGPTIRKVHEYIDQRSSLAGKHHEVYLSDIRRAAPANWRTVIRQPMNSTEVSACGRQETM